MAARILTGDRVFQTAAAVAQGSSPIADICELEDTLVTVTGEWVAVDGSRRDRTFQASVSGTGAVSSTVVIEVCNDKTNPIVLGTITLSGTGQASDGFASQAVWGYTRARVSAISGTGARTVVTMGV